jgi:hypothetical protein
LVGIKRAQVSKVYPSKPGLLIHNHIVKHIVESTYASFQDWKMFQHKEIGNMSIDLLHHWYGFYNLKFWVS